MCLPLRADLQQCLGGDMLLYQKNPLDQFLLHQYGSGASSFRNREKNDEAKHFFLCMENSS